MAPPLNMPEWEHKAIGDIFSVTLDKAAAEASGYDVVWLKYLDQELRSEDPGLTTVRLNTDIVDRLLISRLELDPQSMTDDLDYLPVLTSLPPEQTVFEYLVGCWQRVNQVRSALAKKGYPPTDTQKAVEKLEKIKDLVVSYAGLILQEAEMFPQPSTKPLGPVELVNPLLSMSAFSTPLGSSPQSGSLSASDVEPFLHDLARRFEPDDELDGVLGPVVKLLVFHPSLALPEGIAGADASWRGVLGGLEALVSVKPIAVMVTRMPEFNPEHATAATFERVALLGPLSRMNVFGTDWPTLARTYFSDLDKRGRGDLDSSFASLRGTLNGYQTSLFSIYNALVRASPVAREAVLRFFARVIALNVRRAGMQVDPATVSSDSFMVNLQTVLLRFADPFMDATYSKMDKIDPLYLAKSDRLDLSEETRIKATSEEAKAWEEEQRNAAGPAPNFISEIFYLSIAMCHYGLLKTVDSYNEMHKQINEYQRQLDQIQGDGSWMGSPHQARTQQALDQGKIELNKLKSHQMTFAAQLLDPDLLLRHLGFTNFLSTWVIRQVDPLKTHPAPSVELPLPQEVPMSFRVLPEYILEDIVDHYHFVTQDARDKFDVAGKNELLMFVLTFLTSTWYIKNPFLKSKINDTLFMGLWGYGRERGGVLGTLLNSHPKALKHLMPAMMHFYIEVEQTGASSQFYDKFSTRSIAYVLKYVWDNPVHREALNLEAIKIDKFVRFVNLMINDVTYLMDESLSEMMQIHNIQVEMDDQASWNAKPQQHRREREAHLRSLERQASSYAALSRSTVELLKIFTAETKAPFMMPEIVDRLAAMLDYNLNALIGARYQELHVRNPEKLSFKPRELLSDIIQIFINLSDQPDFVRAVANDGRSYSKELFERAAGKAVQRSLKTEQEVAVLRLFVEKVEEARMTIEAEDDLGEVPDEFLDPLMFTVMRDPVMLPSSRTIIDRPTIKSHLLSDSKDPFNRMPLSIEDVIEQPELKARIETYLVDRRSQAKAAAAADAMDTS
ncbi:ubiquitin elongating factor core-domain-containing protein [Schizophyllum amplum]|uniref:RING-type E3 ubiquitin transferase n=1 Tax=Schizophyllum amplum TaxID=97359 RepID=A0A550CH50_9AGAR|nr:ubiquitin elongating factor core-domain-containing protein [Auriculariopsis ampla]